MSQIKVLFVCMGNICRSPTAHGVFRHLVEQASLADRVHVDSAGTHAYHVGEAPDRRASATAAGRGIQLDDLRARKVIAADFDEFDYVLAMDSDNLGNLHALCPPALRSRLSLFMDFAPDWKEDEVPDPYYGGQKGFDLVLDMVEAASQGLLEHIRKTHL